VLRLVHPNNMTFSQHFPFGKFDVVYCLIAYIELFYQTNNTRLFSVLSVDLKQSCLNNVFFPFTSRYTCQTVILFVLGLQGVPDPVERDWHHNFNNHSIPTL